MLSLDCHKVGSHTKVPTAMHLTALMRNLYKNFIAFDSIRYCR
ncbi:conserved hypothetical protein [Brochothrix thermosphacta]|nr:conserved hypothetical protein [Brochothrix thermosphacta]